MLRLLLDLHGGALPRNYKVLFTNTGKEHTATYTFLQQIRDTWRVDIQCIELTGIINDRLVCYEHRTLESCSRDGAPWRVLMRYKKAFPPRRANRLCTVYMKVLPSLQFAGIEQGWEAYTNLLGYRADEGGRLHRALLRCGTTKLPYVPAAPLHAAGLDKNSVLAFFRQAAFDLSIPDNCGNCTFCFLKGETKLVEVMRALPGEIDWWIDLEAEWGVDTDRKAAHPLQYTILPHGGYLGLKTRAMQSLAPPDAEDDIEDLECNCTD